MRPNSAHSCMFPGGSYAIILGCPSGVPPLCRSASRSHLRGGGGGGLISGIGAYVKNVRPEVQTVPPWLWSQLTLTGTRTWNAASCNSPSCGIVQLSLMQHRATCASMAHIPPEPWECR